MITAGIDLGSHVAKGVILNGDTIAGRAVLTVGWDAKSSTHEVLEEAVRDAGIDRSRIQRIIATGGSRRDVAFADDMATEVATAAKGINFLYPSVRTVIDIGAEGSRTIKCDDNGRALDFAKNDKCAAGVGAFVEAMARALEVELEDMGALSLQSVKQIPMNATCSVFAESEVVSLIHAKTEKADIAHAIHDAIATRATAMTRRVGIEKDVAFIGGTAMNVGLVEDLKRHLELDSLLVPDEPQIVVAIGAALLARS